MGVIPLAIAGAAVGGLASDAWAVAALLSGIFLVVFFIGIWTAPSTTGGFAAVVAVSVGAAILLTGAVVGFGALAAQLPDEPRLKEAPTSSRTSSRTVTSSSCSSATNECTTTTTKPSGGHRSQSPTTTD